VDHSALLITSDTGVGYDVLRLRGELDVFSNTMLRGMVQDEPLQQDVLILDLCGLSFMDSSGIASLVFSMRNTADRDAELVLVADTPHIVRLIRMAGLHKVASLYPTEAAYVAEVHGSDVAG
jgi:anti-sigma B factor antagonist